MIVYYARTRIMWSFDLPQKAAYAGNYGKVSKFDPIEQLKKRMVYLRVQHWVQHVHDTDLYMFVVNMIKN